MAEEELEALRKQRLAELQAKHGDPGDAAQQEAKHREAEIRNSILAQVLDQSARAHLSNLAFNGISMKVPCASCLTLRGKFFLVNPLTAMLRLINVSRS
uniref:Programmed cell death 5 n=1 Tax=Neovison vison TaxID=452646 RepID=A0A8C7EK91_NEOVI